jgi:hypothetical protein
MRTRPLSHEVILPTIRRLLWAPNLANMDDDNLAIFLPLDGKWVESLVIPKAAVTRMSTRPHKWLRFLCYSILNSTGKLCVEEDLEIEEQEEEEDPSEHPTLRLLEVAYNDVELEDEYYYDPGQHWIM